MPPLVQPSPVIRMQFFDANGDPLANGFVYTFAAGTSTPLATYTDHTANTQNTNPIQLDSGGYADIWLTADSYKIRVENELHVSLYTIDGVPGLGSLITVGDLPPLFTTTLAGGALSFTLSDAAPGTLLGRFAGTTGPPSYGVIGSDTQVTFNKAGQMAGDSEFTYNETTKVLTIKDAGTANAQIKLAAVGGGGGFGGIFFGNVTPGFGITPRICFPSNLELTAPAGTQIRLGHAGLTNGFVVLDTPHLGLARVGEGGESGELQINDGTSVGGVYAGASIIAGTGDPENVITAPVGSLFLRTDGGAATSLYVKESGAGNTGWVGK